MVKRPLSTDTVRNYDRFEREQDIVPSSGLEAGSAKFRSNLHFILHVGMIINVAQISGIPGLVNCTSLCPHVET